MTATFQVTIDGKKRQVVSSEFIDAATGLPREPTAATPQGSGKPQAGNIYVLAVDQGRYRPVNAPSVTYASANS